MIKKATIVGRTVMRPDGEPGQEEATESVFNLLAGPPRVAAERCKGWCKIWH